MRQKARRRTDLVSRGAPKHQLCRRLSHQPDRGHFNHQRVRGARRRGGGRAQVLWAVETCRQQRKITTQQNGRRMPGSATTRNEASSAANESNPPNPVHTPPASPCPPSAQETIPSTMNAPTNAPTCPSHPRLTKTQNHPSHPPHTATSGAKAPRVPTIRIQLRIGLPRG